MRRFFGWLRRPGIVLSDNRGGPWGPGGGADQVARKLGQLLEPQLKVSLPVINVPGATGQTGHAKLMAANADGYTIEVMTGDTFALLADPNAKLKLADFIPLGIVIQQASGFFAAENGPYKTWADVEKSAKERPLKVAVTGLTAPTTSPSTISSPRD